MSDLSQCGDLDISRSVNADQRKSDDNSESLAGSAVATLIVCIQWQRHLVNSEGNDVVDQM